MQRSLMVAVLSLLPCWTVAGSAQQLTPPGASLSAAHVVITGTVGKKKLQASGPGTCRHAPEASLRGASASMWMVQFQGSRDAGVGPLNLTLWRFKDGSPDRLSLALESGSGSHRIDTSNSEEKKGEATVTILPNGPGGRLELTGKNAGGKALQLTIDCPAFTGFQAEGG
ncbi:MAG TPA: hypothetical protein VHH32_01330 [Gemmatimonadales bacterium]|nr:hypothetical protein [Gemmatimonadales bacterium]